MKPFIYALVDPIEPLHVRYVGMTTTDPKRPLQHSRDCQKYNTHTHTQHWIKSLHISGREYSVVILEEFPEDTDRSIVCQAERDFIYALKAAGHNLTNGTDGGEGLHNPSAEVRARISAAVSKRMWGKRYAAGHVVPPEERAKRSARMKGNKLRLGSVQSEVTRAKIKLGVLLQRQRKIDESA